jgi:DDE family transposase
MLGIAAAFAALKDPRRPNARHHKLLDILVIAFCASLCGAESCVDSVLSGKRRARKGDLCLPSLARHCGCFFRLIR